MEAGEEEKEMKKVEEDGEKDEPTPPGVNFAIVLFPKFAT